MGQAVEKKSGLALLQGGGQPPAPRGWFLVNTAAKGERLAKAHLSRQGITVYLPMRASKSKRTDVAKSTPLFPGYLFVQVELAAPRWSDICTTQGVAGLVKLAGGGVARVPDREVTRLRDRELFGLVSLEDRKASVQASGLKSGERVRIKGGVWAGLDAVFDRDLTDLGRVKVLMDMLGRVTPVELAMGDVAKAG